ncbi:type II toxin-antitoxin system ParD family antitoxin [Myroides odoratimimus]|nr:type II toxin-antitoxin system ParD family antitoxin [Myroides odoratimimus]
MNDYFDNFINLQIKSGKYSSASEIIRTALRMFEYEEAKKN